jgi:hypothetical protein
MILDHSVRSEIIIRIVACDNYDGFQHLSFISFMKVCYTIRHFQASDWPSIPLSLTMQIFSLSFCFSHLQESYETFHPSTKKCVHPSTSKKIHPFIKKIMKLFICTHEGYWLRWIAFMVYDRYSIQTYLPTYLPTYISVY